MPTARSSSFSTACRSPLGQGPRLPGSAGGRHRGLLLARLQPGVEPRRGCQRRPEAGGHPQGAGAQQGAAQARRGRAHAQAVEATPPRPQLLRARDLPLRRLVQDHPGRINRCLVGVAGLALAATAPPASGAPFMIVGNDEKVAWDDEGKLVLSLPGRDNVVVLDLAEPESPKVVATLPLKNSVVGPPVNLAIDPTNSVALVADSVDVVKEGEALRQVPDDKLHVIDLKASPPRIAATLRVGR